MRYDTVVGFMKSDNKEFNDKAIFANVTQMGFDEAVEVFGNAKRMPYIIRFPNRIKVRTGYMGVMDSRFTKEQQFFPLIILKVINHYKSTVIYAEEYHGNINPQFDDTLGNYDFGA